MRTSVYTAAAVLLSVVFASGTLHAQSPAEKVLASIKTLKCTFSVQSTAKWVEGVPQAQVRMGPTLTFTYYEVNPSESSANVEGLASEGHVVVQLVGANMHFLEMKNTGGLMLTTVFGQVTTNRKLKAIYTRADFLPISVPGFENSPDVSQHYGECEILP